MKRNNGAGGGATGATTKKPKGTPIGHLEFVLLPHLQRIPEDGAPFDGYYQGSVHILACPSKPDLVGKHVSIKSYGFLSCAPYYLYGTGQARYDDLTMCLHHDKDATLCNVIGLKPKLVDSDLLYLVRETTFSSPRLSQLAFDLVRTNRMVVVPAQQIPPTLELDSDIYKLPDKRTVMPYFLPNRYDSDQRKALQMLTKDGLGKLKSLLSTQPWELVYPGSLAAISPNHPIKPLQREAYIKALRDFRLEAVVPPHIKVALCIFFNMMDGRENDKHTGFIKSQYNSLIPCMHATARAELEQEVFAYLTERALGSPLQTGGGIAVMLSLREDYMAAFHSVRRLKEIRLLSATEEPNLRGVVVPTLFPKLTARQAEIADYIRHHWLTIVEGLPGTGKTALITWAFSHYSDVMLVSFVGMMVKSLQKRNGKRREAAYTIHYILALAKYCGDDAADWLKHFTVLIVDEFSNVSMKLFSKLLRVMPNLKKVIFVGDHRQLKPIECGDPMGDLIDAFGSHLLRDNLRVASGLAPLQEAPKLITENRSREIRFGPPGGLSPAPISFISKVPESDELFFQMFNHIYRNLPNGKSILNTHVVILLNKTEDGRNAINKACETAWIRMGVLKPPSNPISLRYGMSLYPGLKITFTQNYNSPINVTFGAAAAPGGGGTKSAPKGITCKSDPVANGELAIIKSVSLYPSPATGIKLEIVDSEDPDDDPEVKTVWIDAKQGVDPHHVDLGFATTTYKTQGTFSFSFCYLYALWCVYAYVMQFITTITFYPSWASFSVIVFR